MTSDSRRVRSSRTMRVALFFLWFLGVVIGVPALFLAGMLWREVTALEGTAPRAPQDAAAVRAALSRDATLPATDAGAAFPQARAASMALWDDGTRLVLLDARDAAGADTVRQIYLTSAGADVRSSTDLLGRFSSWRFTTLAGEHGELISADGTVVIVAGPSAAAVAARLAALRAREDVPALAWALSAPVGAAMGSLLLWTLLPVGVWTLLAVPCFGRMASWAGASPAASGVAPVDAALLRQRLLMLASSELPFAVTPGARPDELYVDWRYTDARLTPALRLAGRRRAHRIVLRLDQARQRVRAQDRHASLDWSAGTSPALASLDWRASRGITLFEVEHQTEVGIALEGGRVVATGKGSYTFSVSELKAPVIALVTQSGWEWRPVIGFSPLLGG